MYLYSIVFRPDEGPTQLPTQWVQVALSPGLMWPVYEHVHSCPSSARVNEGGAMPLALSFHDMALI
jgi:hypothetical protein